MPERRVRADAHPPGEKAQLLTVFTNVNIKEKQGSRVFSCGENSHALRLENASLRESLSDLRAANANLIRYTFGVRSYARHTGAAANRKTTKKIFFEICH